VDASAVQGWFTRAFVAEAESAARRARTGYRPTVEYHPDMVHGFCSRCKRAGAMTYATAMTLRQMDRIMDGKPVTFPYPICVGRLRDGTPCLGREFVPIDIRGRQADALDVVRKSQDAAVSLLPGEAR